MNMTAENNVLKYCGILVSKILIISVHQVKLDTIVKTTPGHPSNHTATP